MSMPPDLHMHTPLCHHALGLPVDYAAQAKRIGLSEIGISDHSPMAQAGFDDWRMDLEGLPAYLHLVDHARRDHPDLAIRIALEVDYLPGQEDWIRDLAGRHPWDYFIGSVHYVEGGWDIDNPGKVDEWRRRDPDEVWEAYLERLLLAVESGLFDILGHLDLPKKFGFLPHQDVFPWYRRILKVAGRRGTAIELNTAGLRKDCREIYPAEPILRLAHEHRVPITFGSDAHAPEEVGAAFAEAIALARRAGYTHALRFVARQSSTVRLPRL